MIEIETKEAVVRLEQDVATHMNGWSKVIRPERQIPGETMTKQRLWLNTYLDVFFKPEDD